MDIKGIIIFSALVNELNESLITDNRSFNLIQAVVRGRLHETSHSRILGELLIYDSEILKFFLDDLIQRGLSHQKENWTVLIEKDNIDILIQGESTVVIIENKVNNAPEQYRQIDRYVEQRLAEGFGNIYVLYLSREYPFMPSEYSFNSTKNRCRLITKTYKKDIREWVNDKLLTRDQPFSIHSALFHYKNYLDTMINSNSSEISEEIRMEIEKYLKYSACKGDEIVALEKLSRELWETSEICKKLMYEKIWANIQSKLNGELNEKGLPQLISMQNIGWDLPDAGIEFSIEGMENKFYAVVSYLRQRYIGIIDRSNTGKLDDNIVNTFKDLFAGIYSNSPRLSEWDIYSTYRYPYWFNVDDNDCLISLYLKLMDILRKSDDVTIIYPKK